ncbi:MAG: dephospho-CoA kinase [Alphaproteobacteria bacterium]
MIIIGLTGSIGMGKSTTAAMFRDAGCPVFDADAAVHALYAKGGEAVPLIKAVFPDAIKDEAIDRAVLGMHMRSDPLNLKVLESFIHPMVAKKRAAFLEQAKRDRVDCAVFDVPLLFETGGHKYVDQIVVVTAPEEVQKKRVLSRDGMTEDLFKSLLGRQMPDAKKRVLADYLIFTDKGLDHARKQVQTILSAIKSRT